MRPLLLTFALAALVGCDQATEPVPTEPLQTEPVATEPVQAEPASEDEAAVEPAPEPVGDEVPREARVMFLGDSLTAGLGVAAPEAYPALVGARLEQEGWPVRVINAGVSGDTSAGGRSRIGWLLQQRPVLVVVALGANDGLRGLPVESLEENLEAIITASREAGARVLLLGMRVPPNYGEEYATRFEAVYPRLAERLDVPLMPFMLESVGGRAELNQADGIHPNPAGHQVIAVDVMPYLERALRQVLNKGDAAAEDAA